MLLALLFGVFALLLVLELSSLLPLFVLSPMLAFESDDLELLLAAFELPFESPLLEGVLGASPGGNADLSILLDPALAVLGVLPVVQIVDVS